MEFGEDADDQPGRVCIECGKSFKYPSQLRLHQQVHSLARPFPCDKCGRTFKYASTLSEHEKTHVEAQPYRCNICGRGFAYRSNFNAHKAIHTNEGERERAFRCQRCPAAYFHRTHLREHIAAKHSLTAARPDAANEAGKASDGLFNCKICAKSYKYKNSLLEHQRGHRKQRRLHRPIKCTVCHVTFEDVFKLRQHVEIDDADARRHLCCKCGRTFTRRCHLALHSASAHRFKRRHNCQLCGKTFLLLKCLRQHDAWVHADGAVSGCPKCGKLIRGGAAGMRAHAAIHAKRRELLLRKEAADDAGRTRQQKQQLQKQRSEKKKAKELQKENETPATHDKQFSCDICSKQFPRLFNLQRHHRKVHDRPIHLVADAANASSAGGHQHCRFVADPDSRPFECDRCSRPFRWERNLKAHLIAVHREGGNQVAKMHKCGQCDKAFASQARLDTHARSHSSAQSFRCKQCDSAYKHKKNLVAHVKRCHSRESQRGVEDESDTSSEEDEEDQ